MDFTILPLRRLPAVQNVTLCSKVNTSNAKTYSTSRMQCLRILKLSYIKACANVKSSLVWLCQTCKTAFRVHNQHISTLNIALKNEDILVSIAPLLKKNCYSINTHQQQQKRRKHSRFIFLNNWLYKRFIQRKFKIIQTWSHRKYCVWSSRFCTIFLRKTSRSRPIWKKNRLRNKQ